MFATAGVPRPSSNRTPPAPPSSRGLDVRARAGVEQGRLDPRAEALPACCRGRRGRRAREGLDLVVETVPEHPALKAEVLAAAEARGRPARHQHQLAVDRRARRGLARPQAFLGMHFFNPVWSLPLVEIVRGAATGTAPSTPPGGPPRRSARSRSSSATCRASRRAGSTTSPRSRRCGCSRGRGQRGGHRPGRRARLPAPVGPLRLSDIVGLDVRLDIARHLAGSTASGSPPRDPRGKVPRGARPQDRPWVLRLDRDEGQARSRRTQG